MYKQKHVGVIGMGIMGKNLALNIESKGYNVAVYNRSKNKLDQVIFDNPEKKLIPFYSIKEFVLSLKRPRIIFLMITSGLCIDHMIQELSFYLNVNDILIDGGNSFYKDTMRRDFELSKKEINFFGIGISGGEEGALKGPALMPGGKKCVYQLISPLLTDIAARFNSDSCVTYIGPNGSGHYVKMMHNAMEYGEMQLIAEVYFLLKKIFHLKNMELATIFNEWNKGELSSYLIEITSRILMKKDGNGYLIDYISDITGNKGTGSWASKDSFDLGVPLGMVAGSVFNRYLSVLKNQRLIASKRLLGPNIINNMKDKCKDLSIFVDKVGKALYLSRIILYAQSFYQLKLVSNKYDWNLDYKEIAKIFRAGCIIRSKFLQKIIDIYTQESRVENLLLVPYCVEVANNYQQMLRDIVIDSVQHGIPVPVLSEAISYYDGYRNKILPTNLIQAQRDYFGAHTYTRTDRQGIFHTEW